MTTAIAIEDVRREVKILKALTGHANLVQFYDAYEDDENVYIVMEWVFYVVNFSWLKRWCNLHSVFHVCVHFFHEPFMS